MSVIKWFCYFLVNKGRCRLFHIDDNPSGAIDVIQDFEGPSDEQITEHATTNPICAVSSTDKCLIVARESGLLQHYVLPHIALINKYKINSRPLKLAINCNSRYSLSVGSRLELSNWWIVLVDVQLSMCRECWRWSNYRRALAGRPQLITNSQSWKGKTCGQCAGRLIIHTCSQLWKRQGCMFSEAYIPRNRWPVQDTSAVSR